MIARRTEEISPFLVMDVLERACTMACQGIDVIHLEVGEPDFDTPQCIKEAICKALADGFTHYTHSLGCPELREAIREHYRATYAVSVHPDQVVVTSGTSPAMLLAFAALLERGDQVIISDPGYACYPNFIKFVEGVPVTVPVYEEDGFQYRPKAIAEKITPQTKAILINSPSNPTGNLLSAERIEAIAGFAARHLGRDLSRTGVRGAGALDPRVYGGCLRPEWFLETVRHDGPAAGLPDRPQSLCPAHPKDAAELFHLRQRGGADRGDHGPARDRGRRSAHEAHL